MIRAFRNSDIPRLLEMQEKSGTKWELPDFDSPEMLSARVFTDDDGDVVMFAGAKRAAEVFCTIDPEWESPGARWEALKALYGAVEHDLECEHIPIVVGTVSDRVARPFMRRLAQEFGWKRMGSTAMLGYVRRYGA